jgi:hypothetical protein
LSVLHLVSDFVKCNHPIASIFLSAGFVLGLLLRSSSGSGSNRVDQLNVLNITLPTINNTFTPNNSAIATNNNTDADTTTVENMINNVNNPVGRSFGGRGFRGTAWEELNRPDGVFIF